MSSGDDMLQVRLRVVAEVVPALPHLGGEGGTTIQVGGVYTVPSQGDLEALLVGTILDMARDLGGALIVHPRRPTENEQRGLHHREFMHDVNTGMYPQLRPTPAEPGHQPGHWTACPRCIDYLTEQDPR